MKSYDPYKHVWIRTCTNIRELVQTCNSVQWALLSLSASSAYDPVLQQGWWLHKHRGSGKRLKARVAVLACVTIVPWGPPVTERSANNFRPHEHGSTHLRAHPTAFGTSLRACTIFRCTHIIPGWSPSIRGSSVHLDIDPADYCPIWTVSL
jgi:hypothetical protein